MKRIIYMASVVLTTMAIYSCGEGTDSIGQSITNTEERLEIGTPIEFPVETQSYVADSVFTQSSTCYLGLVRDPETLTDVKSEFSTQFHLLDVMRIPQAEKFVSISNQDNLPVADSCDLILYVSNPFNASDSLLSIKMTVHEFRPVYPYRILPRDIRRHERNRIIDIQILFLPVAKALPAPRNGYPVLKPDTAHRLRNLKHRTEITEIPFAVQHPDSFFSICPFRQIIRSRLFQIFTQNVRIRNFPCYQEVFLLLNIGLFPERLCLRPGFDPLSLRGRANPLKSGLAFLRIPGPPDQSPKYRPALIDLPLRQTGQLYMNPTWYAILSGGKKLPNARSTDMRT